MMRSSLIVALFGWSTIAAAQPATDAPAGPPNPDDMVQLPPEPAPEKPFVAPGGPPPEAPPEPPAAKGPKITVMFAPLRLIVPLVEFTGEYRVADKLGVSVLLGAGKRTIEGSTGDATGTEFEIGAQVRVYVVGSFRHGMQVGVEALEEYVKFEEPLPPGIVGVAAGGLTLGPFLGYKIATGSGFTFEAQLGARYLVVEPTVYGSSAGSFEGIDKWLPLLHLNIGWSF